MQQPQATVAAPATSPTPGTGEFPVEAPPKQVALAMDRLSHAGRLIADIRLGADRLLEALFVAADRLPHQSDKPLNLILKEEASMRQHLEDLRTVGRQLEASGVLNGSLRSRGNSWGLHMPLVCPDGAVVAYAWKRQLAGQAGASAVDRTREATIFIQEVFQYIMYTGTSRNMLIKHCSILWASNLRRHYTFYCNGSAAIKRYLQKFAVNVIAF